ncbi:MAG: hypothetical protein M1335_01780, partial [Chloroflexi bacterium]|nr:hypothetical protein [Chloroflexota bacterium]
MVDLFVVGSIAANEAFLGECRSQPVSSDWRLPVGASASRALSSAVFWLCFIRFIVVGLIGCRWATGASSEILRLSVAISGRGMMSMLALTPSIDRYPMTTP